MTRALLDGLTVLDFTRVLAGPYCTRLLADLGARVIKVERPGQGDDTRAFHLQLEAGRTDQSSYFVRFNAGKQSVAIDLAHPQARPVVLDLARAADVLIENFVPGIMARHASTYARARAPAWRLCANRVRCSRSCAWRDWHSPPWRSWR
jgi:crotonobetainyl-CoA:carnitine CoA-transferase CaiB-like acyl-CoA transferase